MLGYLTLAYRTLGKAGGRIRWHRAAQTGSSPMGISERWVWDFKPRLSSTLSHAPASLRAVFPLLLAGGPLFPSVYRRACYLASTKVSNEYLVRLRGTVVCIGLPAGFYLKAHCFRVRHQDDQRSAARTWPTARTRPRRSTSSVAMYIVSPWELLCFLLRSGR
jgi:hypothetical protein